MNSKQQLAGIDYSMSNPTICLHPGNGSFDLKNCSFFYLTGNKKAEGKFFGGKIVGTPLKDYKTPEQRYYQITLWALDTLGDIGPIAMEDYAMAAKGRVFNIGENTGMLKFHLWKMQKSFTLVPPTVIKKYATGKGNANKDKMHEAFLAETKVDVMKIYSFTDTRSPVSDIVDAYYITKYCFEKLKNEEQMVGTDRIS